MKKKLYIAPQMESFCFQPQGPILQTSNLTPQDWGGGGGLHHGRREFQRPPEHATTIRGVGQTFRFAPPFCLHAKVFQKKFAKSLAVP